MIYKIGHELHIGKEFMGSARNGGEKYEAYKNGDWIYVFVGNTQIGRYNSGRFTVYDSLNMAAVGLADIYNTDDLSSEDYNDLDAIDLDSVNIVDDDEYEYTI